MIRVAFLDDHPAVRAGLQAIVAPEPDLQSVGFAADEEQFWPLLRRTRPAVVVLDVHHPGRDGLTLCLQIKRELRPPAVVLYSATAPAALLVAGTVAGADAVVSKSTASRDLLDAIRAVARAPHQLPSISRQLKTEAAARLDPADHAILAMRLVGDTLADIGDTLGRPVAAIADRITAIVAILAGASPAARDSLPAYRAA
jgi:DNA-binding NarL/FixJ family response regulator